MNKERGSSSIKMEGMSSGELSEPKSEAEEPVSASEELQEEPGNDEKVDPEILQSSDEEQKKD